MFVSFTPAISPASAKRIRQRVRRWRLNLRTRLSLEDLAVRLNSIIRGWVQYYGTFQRSTLISVLRHIDRHLVKWVKRKYRKRGRNFERAKRWLGQVARHQPTLFAHWRLARPFPAG
jgi:RNA-directed DNA polymerase